MIWLSLLLPACSGKNDDTADTSGGLIDAPPIVINEFEADNKTYADPDGTPLDTADPGEFDDWIELYNNGDTLIQLDGFYLTDDLNQPTRWALPTGVGVGPGEFYVVWADASPEQGDNHASFQLEKKGESLGLYYAADGEEGWANKVDFGAQAADLSSARVPDGSTNWVAGVTPTPGATNGE